MINDQRGALDHNIHVLSYGHVTTGWPLSSFFTKKTSEYPGKPINLQPGV